MTNFTFQTRKKQLKLMHQLMLTANDEEIYGCWICEVPDEPTEDDFDYIAGNYRAYNDACNMFVELVKQEGYRW